MQVRTLPVYGAGDIGVPYIVGATAEQMQIDTTWSAHSHPTHELLWNQGGASTVVVDDVTHVITDFWGLWIPAGVLHSGFTPQGSTCRAAHFNIHSVQALDEKPIPVEITGLLGQLLDRLVGGELSHESRWLTERMVVDVLAPAESTLSVRMPRADLVQPIVVAAMADPAHRVSLRQWASRLGVSTKTVTRTFKHDTGMGFSQWLAQVRAQHAVVMLASGDEVEDVARATGYATASGFGAAFRKATGGTPGAYRR